MSFESKSVIDGAALTSTLGAGQTRQIIPINADFPAFSGYDQVMTDAAVDR
jgi:hypothetical protein